jgi:hypothetical protein
MTLCKKKLDHMFNSHPRNNMAMLKRENITPQHFTLEHAWWHSFINMKGDQFKIHSSCFQLKNMFLNVKTYSSFLIYMKNTLTNIYSGHALRKDIVGTSMHITFSKSLFLLFPMIFNKYPITKRKVIICIQFLQLKNVIYN